MKLDNTYLKKLTAPLKGKLGLSPSEYFAQLERNGVKGIEEDGRLTSKFIAHAEYLIDQGVMVGPLHSESGIKSLGLKVGNGRNVVIVRSDLITLKPQKSSSWLSASLELLRGNIVKVLSGVIVSVLVIFVSKFIGIA